MSCLVAPTEIIKMKRDKTGARNVDIRRKLLRGGDPAGADRIPFLDIRTNFKRQTLEVSGVHGSRAKPP